MRRLQRLLLAAGTACAALAMQSGLAAGATSDQPLKPLGPPPDNCGVLISVAVLSGTNAWGVGESCNGPTGLIEHWDGRQVIRAHVPQTPAAGDEEYHGVAAAGPSNIWAVGGDSGDVGLIAHYNGTKWRLMPGPTANSVGSYLWEVRLAANGDAWITGEVGNGAALVRVHNGKDTVIRFRNAGNGLGGLYLASATDIWAGGGGYLVHGDGGTGR